MHLGWAKTEVRGPRYVHLTKWRYNGATGSERVKTLYLHYNPFKEMRERLVTGKTTIDFHGIVNQHGKIGAILILLVNYCFLGEFLR